MTKELTLTEFAERVLFGTRLADKLAQPLLLDDPSTPKPIEIPEFPGRPPEFNDKGRVPFPSLHLLDQPLERAKILHFFANHELLALELMALMLLRFPDAPRAFRKGVAAIMKQEQDHLLLYIQRMNELGLELGALPLNHYFWNTLKTMKSPMDFTLQMSLTFEQANLDFSLYYQREIEKIGDLDTSGILNRVYLEEIEHVKHGVHWFNQWRPSSPVSDWDYYIQNLPHPLNPQRAKGILFCAEARKKAGLSEKFIRELRVYSGSKGRPPSVWIYNPHCDADIARNKPGLTPSEGARAISADLETVPLFLTGTQDILLVKKKPRTEFLENLKEFGFKIPEITEYQEPFQPDVIAHKKIGGLFPWGWSPTVFQQFRPLRDRLVRTTGGNSSFCETLYQNEQFEQTGLGKLFSKAWSVQYLKEWVESHPESPFAGYSSSVGHSFSETATAVARIDELLASGNPAMVKAPYGTSGMQVKKVTKVEAPIQGWVKNCIESQGAIVVEPWLNKAADFSIQLEIRENKIELFPVRQFITGPQNEYRGTFLGEVCETLPQEALRPFHELIPFWQGFARDLGHRLQKEGYLGPAGIDGLLWRDQNGSYTLKPLVELNPRWTMGRVALKLEKHLLPGVHGIWKFLSIQEARKMGFQSLEACEKELRKIYPPIFKKTGSQLRLASGLIPTQDPKAVKQVLPVLGTLPNPHLTFSG